MIPSKNPIIIKATELFTDHYFKYWWEKHVNPIYKYKKTSGYRDPVHNKEVGGVDDSAHLYALALDFIITNENGQFVGQEKQSEIFNIYIKPFWPGFALDEKNHIHVNLDRELQKKIEKTLLIAGGAGGYILYNILT